MDRSTDRSHAALRAALEPSKFGRFHDWKEPLIVKGLSYTKCMSFGRGLGHDTAPSPARFGPGTGLSRALANTLDKTS